MRLEKQDQTTPTPTQSPSLDQFIVGQPHGPAGDDQTSPDSPAKDDYFAFIAQATNDAVRDWDVKTGALSWPQGVTSLLGYDASSLEQHIKFWQEKIHPSDRDRVCASIRDTLAGTSDRWSGEYRFRRADGRDVSILERALILREADGAATRFIGSLMDITERKQLQDQLCRSQRMEAFGQLAAGVAHDFNNFLTTILGYGDLLLHEKQIKGTLADHVVEIRAAAGRASALTQQLLAFSRKQPLEPKVVEINSIITNLERSLLRLIGENIAVVCQLHQEKGGAHIKADPSQITQIILNLAVNARDAMPHGGQLTLETAVADLTAQTQSPFECGAFAPGRYVLVSIRDTGIGMSEEVKTHLFEPFFTTKTDERRSGLGLATSYGIVHQSGGHLRVDSQEGKGTTVQIYLPRVAAPPAARYKKPGAKKIRGGTETVLVLEDDVSVRHISVRMLRALGYKVIEAANSTDAHHLLSENGGRKVDLLLTDMVMPQISGRRFADALQAAQPDLKVLFVSGYLEESLQPSDRCEPGMFFLPKPFDVEQLAAKVREALDA
jgi:PAS domain S-box-containing protein